MLAYTAFGGAFGLFAAIALVLSSVGLYALVSYSVTQRTREIGVRMAVGSRRRDVVWLFLRRGLVQLAIGVALGLAGAFAVSGVLSSVPGRNGPEGCGDGGLPTGRSPG